MCSSERTSPEYSVSHLAENCCEVTIMAPAPRQPDSGDDRLCATGRWTRRAKADGSVEPSETHTVVILTRHRRLRGALAPKRQLPARQTWIEEQLKSELAMDFQCGRREAAQLEELRDTQRPSSKRSARQSRPWMRRRTRGSFRTMHCCGACVNWAFRRDEDQA